MPRTLEEYVVRSKKRETPTTVTLTLTRRDGTLPSFRAGQWLTVYFPDLSPTIGKQYSISSAPCEDVLAITVKAIGRYSNKLSSLSEGDIFAATGPEGSFYSHTPHSLVLVAGGMGITPFRGVIVESLRQMPNRRISLFYSNRLASDIPFCDELHSHCICSSSLKIQWFITREVNVPDPSVACRRLRADDVLAAIQKDEEMEFLISGSVSFVRDQRRGLAESGIRADHLRAEAFF